LRFGLPTLASNGGSMTTWMELKISEEMRLQDEFPKNLDSTYLEHE